MFDSKVTFPVVIIVLSSLLILIGGSIITVILVSDGPTSPIEITFFGAFALAGILTMRYGIIDLCQVRKKRRQQQPI